MQVNYCFNLQEDTGLGFQGWPEYSDPGDWLDYNAGMRATVAASLPLHMEQDLPAVEAPPYVNSECTPPAKKVKSATVTCESSIDIHTKAMRLPMPCPLPTITMFTNDVAQAISSNKIVGIMKLRLERQAAAFYWGLCPWPKASEYDAMAKAMCDQYPQLKSGKHQEYWVSMTL